MSDLQHVRAREQRIERDRTRRDWQQELAAERVLARGKVHGLGVDRMAERAVAQLARLIAALAQDEPAGARLHVRLQEHDRAPDLGLGF